jgi:AraC-like DNA-binding protein
MASGNRHGKSTVTIDNQGRGNLHGDNSLTSPHAPDFRVGIFTQKPRRKKPVRSNNSSFPRKTTEDIRKTLKNNPPPKYRLSDITISDPERGGRWPHAYCKTRGDLGCLGEYAKAAGFRANSLAESLGLPERLLRDAFRSQTGLPLKTWIATVRDAEVVRMLEELKTIQEIAAAVGFSHPKELSREFKRIHGILPSTYRNRKNKGRPDNTAYPFISPIPIGGSPGTTATRKPAG